MSAKILETETSPPGWWDKNLFAKWLAPRNHYTGPEYRWVGLGELTWGKVIFINSGMRLIFGMPINTCVMLMCKIHNFKDDSGVTDINDVASFLIHLKPEVLLAHGGFFIIAKAGEGVVIPPLYIIAQSNSFATKTKMGVETEPRGQCVDVTDSCIGPVKFSTVCLCAACICAFSFLCQLIVHCFCFVCYIVKLSMFCALCFKC